MVCGQTPSPCRPGRAENYTVVVDVPITRKPSESDESGRVWRAVSAGAVRRGRIDARSSGTGSRIAAWYVRRSVENALTRHIDQRLRQGEVTARILLSISGTVLGRAWDQVPRKFDMNQEFDRPLPNKLSIFRDGAEQTLESAKCYGSIARVPGN